MSDVFISYSRKDERFATFMASRLRAFGLTVFVDSQSIAPGAPWLETIQAEVKQSPVFLFLASKAALASTNANQEAALAMTNGARVIPIVWELLPEQLPLWLQRYQAVVLTAKNQAQVLEEINRLVGSLANDKRAKENEKQQQAVTIVALVGLVLAGWAFGTK